ncbi:hypothetical protein D3C79_1005470 [compost metagenome]
MVIDRGQVDFGLGRDGLVAGFGIAERGEQFAGGFEDARTGDGAVLAGFAGGCGHGGYSANQEYGQSVAEA